MVADKLQLQRFELKYIVNEEIAAAVRDFISAYLKIDEYCATQPNLSYPVRSLYLDSDRLTTYWHTINGNKNRFKLRVRFYENQPTAPVFFEIKRRVNDAILKQRGAVRRDAVDGLLAGHLPAPGHIVSNDRKHLAALHKFCELLNQIHARPKAHVAYYREAWISPDNNAVRVTMDRNVRCGPEFTARLTSEMNNPILVFGNNVVLELKFTGRYPLWFGDLVRVFGLRQCAAAKYADGVALLGENAFSPNGVLRNPGFDQDDKLKTRLELLKRNLAGFKTAA